MADCNKSTQKAGPASNSFNFSSILGILTIIANAFKIPKLPVAPLPPPLVAFGANLRPGVSPRDAAARVISRQSQAGAPVGDIFDSTNNISEGMERIRMEEIFNMILTEAKVDVVIPPGVPVTVVGVGNYGAPVISQGATTSFGIGNGIVR